MKIISPFKDYYDYLSTQYGVDNSIVYNRPTTVEFCKEDIKETLSKINNLVKCFHYQIVIKNIEYIFKSIFILGKIYIVVTKITPDNKTFTRLANKEDFIAICELSRAYRDKLKKYKNDKVNYIKVNPNKLHSFGGNEGFISSWANGSTKLTSYLFNRNNLISTKIGVLEDPNNYILEIHKKLQLPVFSSRTFYDYPNTDITNNNNNNKITIAIPNLSEIQGISGIVSTFEIYQGISNFLVELKGNVDLIPPVDLSNDDKIVKAGFDIKSSFRHPTTIIRRKKQ